MSELEFLLKGVVAGFIIAVPIGPVAVLCFRRVLSGPARVGLATVLGRPRRTQSMVCWRPSA